MEKTMVVQMDDRGRILIPKEKRTELGLRKKERVEISLKKASPMKGFVEKWRGFIKTKKTAMELLRQESPFRMGR